MQPELNKSVEAQSLAEQGMQAASKVEETPSLSWELLLSRVKHALGTSSPYLAAVGLLSFLLAGWLLCEVLKAPLFEKIPGPCGGSKEVSRQPVLGCQSSPAIIMHLEKLLAGPQAFTLRCWGARGCSWVDKVFKLHLPVFETLRPIPCCPGCHWRPDVSGPRQRYRPLRGLFATT
jgi:hypothetical protein